MMKNKFISYEPSDYTAGSKQIVCQIENRAGALRGQGLGVELPNPSYLVGSSCAFRNDALSNFPRKSARVYFRFDPSFHARHSTSLDKAKATSEKGRAAC